MHRLSNLPDFIALVPVTLGYEPMEMITVLGTMNKSSGPVMGTDLPTDEDTMGFGVWLAAKLKEVDGVDGAIVIIHHKDRTPDSEGRLPYQNLMSDIGLALILNGIKMNAAVLVTETEFIDYDLPGEVRSLQEVKDSRVMALSVLHGNVITDGKPFIPDGDQASASLSLRVSNKSASMPRITTWEDVLAHPRTVATATDLWSRALSRDLPDGDILPLFEVEWLTAYVQHKALRDFFLAGIIDPATGVEDLGAMVTGVTDKPLDQGRVTRAQAVLGFLLHFAGPEHRGSLLVMYGWTEYIKGLSTTAEHWLHAALEAEPDNRMATLLLTVIRRGIIPQTALTKPSNYNR